MPSSIPLFSPEQSLLYPVAGRTALHFRDGDATAVLSRSSLDFATVDYLALRSHPALRRAALQADHRQQLASGGQSEPDELTESLRKLEIRLARFVKQAAAVVFPSGNEAIRATLLGILRPNDKVIVDAGCNPAMFETVLATHAQLHRCPPGSLDAVERRLHRLSRLSGVGQIYIAVSAVAETTSTVADLGGLVALAALYGARLIVDASHDLGAMAPGGCGVMEMQGGLGRPDIVLGGLEQCFGARGGFAAFRDPTLKTQVQSVRGQGAGLSPAAAATILAAFDLVDSAEGERRRRRLHAASLRLRNRLVANGMRVLGQPSGFVPVLLPSFTAEARAALLASAGPVVPLLKYPVVAGHAPRWSIRLSADHGPADIDDLAELMCEVGRAIDRPARSTRRAEALPQP